MRHASFAPFLLLVGMLASCGGSEAPPGPPATIAPLNDGALSGMVGTGLSEPIRIQVQDADGRGVPGVEVTFIVALFSGRLDSAGTASASAAATTVVDSTDANGDAEASWMLGTKSGTQTVIISVEGLTPVLFHASALPGPAVATDPDSSAGFVGFTSDSLDGELAVLVTDEYGNGVPDQTVTWAVMGGGGSVVNATSTTDTTGVARAAALLGPAPGLDRFTGAVAGFPPDTIDAVALVPVDDPVGDEFDIGSAFTSHDVVRYGMGVVDGIGVIHFRYAEPVAPTPTVGSEPANAIRAWIDVDVDQDTTTGRPAFRTCDPALSALGTFAFGSDVWIDLDPLSLILSYIPDAPDGSFAGARFTSITFGSDECTLTATFDAFLIAPLYGERSVTGVFNFANLGDDDGSLDVTSVHVNGKALQPTDLVPDSLPHTFQLLAPSASMVAGVATQRLARRLMRKIPPGMLDVRAVGVRGVLHRGERR
jgi:hypothetical protein